MRATSTRASGFHGYSSGIDYTFDLAVGLGSLEANAHERWRHFPKRARANALPSLSIVGSNCRISVDLSSRVVALVAPRLNAVLHLVHELLTRGDRPQKVVRRAAHLLLEPASQLGFGAAVIRDALFYLRLIVRGSKRFHLIGCEPFRLLGSYKCPRYVRIDAGMRFLVQRRRVQSAVLGGEQTVSGLARHCAVSHERIHRVLKQWLGMAPADYYALCVYIAPSTW
jgi:hypothetical protein